MNPRTKQVLPRRTPMTTRIPLTTKSGPGRMWMAVTTALLAWALLSPIAASAQAVIFSDSFTREVNTGLTDSSWGTNDNALGGHLLTEPYLVNPSLQQWVDGAVGRLRGNGGSSGSARILVDLATNAPGGFTLSFKARRSASGGFVGFTLGLGPTNATGGFPPNDLGADFSFLLKPPASGQMRCEVLTNGVSVAPGNYGAFGDATAEHLIEATVTPNGYTGVAQIAITVDGINAFTGQPNFNGSFTWQDDGNQGYITFSANQPDATIDDIVITALNALPQITAQPGSQTNAVGSSVSLTVGAQGVPPLSYQWYFVANDQTNLLPGATSPTLTLDPVALTDAGGYFAVVTNPFGSATSSVAALTVIVAAPPTIDVQPANVTVNKGQPATLAAVVDGSPPLIYQWRKNGTEVLGATSNPYNIPSTVYEDAGSWTLVVTNVFGAITSSPALLTVNDVTLPVISNVTNRNVPPTSPAGTVVDLSDITATDDKDGPVPVSLTPPSGSLFPPGVTVVCATATDASGNRVTNYFSLTVLGTARWQVNFSENFDAWANSFDINFDFNGFDRQSGLLAPIPYTELASTAPSGASDAATQVNHPNYPGKLYLNPAGPPANFVGATLAHEFVESATFAIEVEVNPTAGVGSADWAGIAIGAAYPHSSPDVTGSGLGVLFRGNGQISVFQNQQQALLRNYPWTFPPAPYRVRLEVEAAAFDGSPALLRGFINDVPFPLATNAAGAEVFTYAKQDGFQNNLVVLSGSASSGPVEHTFDDLTLTALPTFFASPPDLATVVGQSNQTFTVTVPPSLVATGTLSVVLSNDNPAVARMVGESGGSLTLNFPAGGAHQETVTVIGLAAGRATLTLHSPSLPVPVGGKPVVVQVDGLPSYIANGSFEEPPVPDFPGFGSIVGWDVSDPSWNGVSPNFNVGGAIPNNSASGHGRNVAILNNAAGAQQISTTLSELTPGSPYELSFLANSQQGAAANGVVSVLIDGALAFSSQLTPVGPSSLGYKPVSLVFTAATSTATLAISSPTFAANSLLVDNFKVKEIRPARWSAVPWTGDEDSGISSANTYTHAYNFGETASVVVNGVTFTGVGGANPAVAGRFSYTAPTVLTGNAQNNLAGSSRDLGNAFVYGSPTPRLTLEGLTPGAPYRLKLFGAGFGPNDGRRASTFMGGGESLSVDENVLGQGNGIIVNYDFTATGTTEVIESRVLAAGTYHLWAIANQVLPVVLAITQSAPNQVRISWLATLTGYQLQASTQVDSGYANVDVTPSLEGNEWVVYQTVAGNRFYRLAK